MTPAELRPLVLAVLTAVALEIFACKARRPIACLRLGRSDRERFDGLRARFDDVGTHVLAQARMFRFTASRVMHALILWGFIVEARR